MGLIQEFKAFALKGNVMDLAVGVIIGGAFGKIVTSLVNDVIMPPVGYLLGGVDFKDLSWTIKEGVEAKDAVVATDIVRDEAGNILYNVGDVISPAVDKVDPVVLSYGNFLQTTIDFLIIAICIFVMIKVFNKLSTLRLTKEQESVPTPEPEPEPAPAPEPEPSKEEQLLAEIRDILKNK